MSFYGSMDINLSGICFVLQMIDEFTDVNRGEKELMKLWNTFSMQNKYESSYSYIIYYYNAYQFYRCARCKDLFFFSSISMPLAY